MEIWKDIKGLEGLYMISSIGRIKSSQNKKTKILKQCINSSGYYHLNIKGKTTDIHILVATHFVDNPHNKKYVNHKDLDKLNNYFLNLEWTTNRENCQHYYNSIGIKNAGVQKIGKKFQVRIRVKGVKKYYGRFNTIEEAIIKRDSIIKKADSELSI